MRHTVTHTYAVLPVSAAAYEEIKAKLEEAGYADQFHELSGRGVVIDMHGIALQREPGRCTVSHPGNKVCGATLCQCEKCSAEWCLDHTPNPMQCPGCGRRPSDDYAT